ncbi:MAG: type II secretion system inner membrane protein GspF [Bdellovibrionales bacterium]|nr:type II secretion system inner membrane protein GspF [Bdellovibrionales bacterium]
MAVYQYTGLTKAGQKTKGVVDADNVRAARAKLRQSGVFPTGLIESRSKDLEKTRTTRSIFGERKISPAQLGIATRQLATLVGAGMPLVESLRALGDQLDHPRLKAVFGEICDRVNEGSTLADAVREHPKVFPRLYPNMIASAEASGTLDLVLERLADLLEAQAALRQKLAAALAYPVLMLCLCLGVVVLLLLYVVPQLTQIFDDYGGVLPLPTRIVIGLSTFVQEQWWLILAVLAILVVGLQRYATTERGRKKIDALRLRLPVVGPLSVRASAARFSRTLGTMLSSGVELLTALSIVKNIVGNVVIEEAIGRTRDGVREGKSLARELDRAEVFPNLLIQMTAIGEKSGQLESMLLRVASNYEAEVESTISALTSILNPLLILLLAGIVGLILVAVLLPMLEMTSFAGQ